MARVPAPKRLRALAPPAKETIGDHGVFAVERRRYAGLPRDVFTFTAADWCNVVAVTPERKLVLVWQFRFGTDALSLEIPGGCIDAGEAPEAAARRELREETGYEAARFELLSVVEPNPALQGNRCFTFVAHDAVPTGTTAFDDLEDLELALVDVADVPALLDEGALTHALVVVALETWLRKSRR